MAGLGYWLLVVGVGISLSLPMETASAQEKSKVADPRAVVVKGNVRFTVLTPRVVRMEWSADGKFEDRPSLTFVQRRLPVPSYKVEDRDGRLLIVTEKMKVEYVTSPDSLTAENVRVAFNTGGMSGTWIAGQANTGNLKGTTRTLDGYHGDLNTKDSTRLRLEDGILSRDGWTLIDDSQRPLLDGSELPWVTPRRSVPSQDWYFFAYGSDYKAALADFVAIAGKIALPPKYVFGYWYSRWRSSSEMEFRELVNTFRSFNIPLDVLVVDMDWHITSRPEFYKEGKRTKDQAGEDYGWTGFTWNRDYFPDPKRFLDWTEEQGLKTCLNLHPASGIQPHESQYEAMARAMGIDPSTKKFVPFNIVDKKFSENYFKLLLHPMEREGVDFWWLDWQQWNTTTIPGVNPTFYLNYVHFTDMERQNGKRPLIYHRWGGLGNHRYQIGFSGDTKIGWESLAYQPYFTTTASNVGFGYWGNDIGGFFGEPNTPEQFVRWFQFGVFSPILKTHATGRNFAILRKPWEYPPESFLQLRDLIQLRSMLIPYIYTAARQAYDTGISLCRPLYYEHPRAEEAYQFPNEYYFGNDLLVHPVTHPAGKDSLIVPHATWLPSGSWFDMTASRSVAGGAVLNANYRINEIPTFAKAGAIIPQQPVMKHVDERPLDSLILVVYPGGDGTAEVYEDAGNDQGFKSGACAFTRLQQAQKGSKRVITISAAEGSYAGMVRSRSFEIRFPNAGPVVNVAVNGTQLKRGWSYDGNAMSAVVHVPRQSVRKQTVVEVTFSPVEDSLIEGTRRRIDIAYQFSKFLADRRNFRKQAEWNDAVYSSDLVMRAAQAGLRISAHPEMIVRELGQFEEDWVQMVRMVEELAREKEAYRPHAELMRTAN